MSEKLQKQITQRTVLIEQQKRIQAFYDLKRDTATLIEAKLRFDALQKQYNNFQAVQSAIELLDQDELVNSTRAEYEENYFELFPKFQEIIDSFEEKDDAASTHSQGSLQPQRVCHSQAIKLHRIEVKKFSGDLTKWMSFHESFIKLVHENQSLDDLTKFHYLRDALTGSAERVIESLELTSANYKEALKLLNDRFHNTKLICREHIRQLFDRPMMHTCSSESLREIIDFFNSHLRALSTLGRPTREWNDLIVHLLYSKLDDDTRSKFDDDSSPNELPVLDDMLQFLNRRSQTLEGMKTNLNLDVHKQQKKSNSRSSSQRTSLITNSLQKFQCTFCQKPNHLIHKCYTFLGKNVNDRTKEAQRLNLCSNCLNTGHQTNHCPSEKRCRKCNERHHTLIHQDNSQRTTQLIEPTQSLEPQRTINSSSSNSQSQHASALMSSQEIHTTLSSSIEASKIEPQSNASNKCTVFLQTALVYLLNSAGVPVLCRAVLDSASHLHFITENLVNQLGLKRFQHCTPISGIGNTITSAKGSTLLTMKSRTTSYEVMFEAEILSKITNLQPQKYCNVQGWNIPRNLNLADPQFNSPQRIDLLIGAELYLQLLSIGQILLADGLPTLQNTVLGWVVSGKNSQILESTQEANSSCLMTCTAQEELSHIVERFWKLEEVNTTAKCSNEEESCEVHFRNHVHRDNLGRYIVSLPLKQPAITLGNSYHMAHKRFMLLEKRLSRNPELRNMYVDFMSEYEQLGHMSPVSEKQIASIHYYLPHHCVTKSEGGSSKIRVVFDASAPTNNGKSLNSIMMVGPVVQNDLVSILIRFRLHTYVFSTDISKMYRQIKVEENDSHLQYILWRNNEESPLQTFRLNTVTYGTSAAPFLATRCLKQLALDEQSNYPAASDILIHDTYVDDILSGSNSLNIAQCMKEDIVGVLKSAGMTLGKWCSNHPALLKDVPAEDRQKLFKIDDGDFTKTLGLYWSPQDDDLRFLVSIPEKSKRITKRSVTSDIARIFDPLGLCGPVIVLGKQFMQQLWKLNLDWDEALPQHLHTSWQTFQEEMGLLNNLRIQRHVNSTSDSNNFQLHGFADASERAYGACLYLRTANSYDEANVQLICSKSRVAPVNNVSLPRLELCAALLLSELVSSVIKIIGIDFDSVHYWTDSQIVLSWIRATSSTWKTFVANRVATIQSLSQTTQWHHVTSTSNPADLISRGLHPQRFIDAVIWFHGPSFLKTNESSWPINSITSSDITIPERKIQKDVLASTSAHNDLLDSCKFQNSFIMLRNTYAYVLRFIHNKFLAKDKDHRRTGPLSILELQMSVNAIVKIVQFNHFAEEIQCLLAGKEVQRNSKLKSLHPFLDNGIIRVGGRLSNSSLPYTTKFPIILPSSHSFTISMATHLHLKSFHTGPNALLARIRSEYWPLNGRHLVRSVVRSCISCFKARPITGEQLMADLPSKRVNMAAPFQNVGIDLCGPFYVTRRIRGKAPTKAYLVVFVCFVVKAIHIEVVTELTTAAFIGAFKRFISTRGLCANVYTDNATNFVGTNSELKELQQLFQSKQHEEAIIKMCQEDNISWHFAPPASPHFGGLYEAAVKSAKHHLRRIVANAALTIEELMTVAKQVEAVLNSRPLTAMSSDPSDFQVITPGHFLIGRPLTSIVEPNIEDEVVSPLKRWRLVQQLNQHFWTRWSSEYLTGLQHRRTWTNVSQNIALHELVLMKDDNLPPLKWKLGRIVKIHPGADGLTRVVDVRTAQGTYTRSITKICPLPISTDDTSQQSTQPQCD